MLKSIKKFNVIAACIIAIFCINFIVPMYTTSAKAASGNSYEVEQMLKQIVSEYGKENILFEDGIYLKVNERLNISNNDEYSSVTWTSRNEEVVAINNNSELLGVSEGTTFIVGQKENKYYVKEVYVANNNDVMKAYSAPNQRYKEQYVVYIDPGHGGIDPGTSGNGLIEKDLVLEIAKNVKNKLKSKGVQVIMSRESDVYVSLSDRSQGANAIGPDVFVSIHINSAGVEAAQGIETFYKKDIDKELASTIQNKLISYTGAVNRGAKWEDFHVVRETNMPASLVECGFLTNVSEANNMKDAVYKDKLANAITDGTLDYLYKNIKLGVLSASRLYGQNRYETSYNLFRRGWQNSETAIIASGVDYPDALCAAPLATKYDAPIVLADNTSLNNQGNLINILKNKGVKKVFIIGGNRIIPGSFEGELSQIGISSERLGGSNRYETSVEIAKKVGNASGEISIVSGLDFADGLSISPISAKRKSPILLTEKDQLPQSVANYISSINVNKSFIIGSESVISGNVQGKLPNVERLGGKDRYETNINVFNKFKNELDLNTIYIASGLDFPDALSASALSGKYNNFLLLSNTNYTEPIVKSAIDGIKNNVSDIVVLGSGIVISDSTLKGLGITYIR